METTDKVECLYVTIHWLLNAVSMHQFLLMAPSWKCNHIILLTAQSFPDVHPGNAVEEKTNTVNVVSGLGQNFDFPIIINNKEQYLSTPYL